MIREDFLPLARPHIGWEELAKVSQVVKSGWWTTGPKVTEFEKKLSAYLQNGTPLHCAALNSATSALFLTLKAFNIKPGDEVIVPTWTFAATAQVVDWLGARPMLCDIEGRSLNMDIGHARTLITPKTRAIIPVHMAGYPCDMDGIMTLSDANNLIVIEDAAHAIGTRYKGIKIGNFSHATCFSFYATKNLAMGEGGAVVSRDKNIIDKVSRLAYFGIDKEAYKHVEETGSWFYEIEELGYKCNLDSMHAALGVVQLDKLDQMNERRRDIARIYRENLDDAISYTEDSKSHFHSFHLFPILLPEKIERNTFVRMMKERNIGVSVHYRPLHKHRLYKDIFCDTDFPNANRLYESIVSIPMFAAMSDQDVAYVIFHINDIIRGMS